jgi:hypothetical protein
MENEDSLPCSQKPTPASILSQMNSVHNLSLFFLRYLAYYTPIYAFQVVLSQPFQTKYITWIVGHVKRIRQTKLSSLFM